MNTAITTTQNQLTEDTILGFIKPLINAIARFFRRLFGKSEWPPSPGSNDRPVVKVKVNVPPNTPLDADDCKNPPGTPDLILTFNGYFRSVDNWDRLILGLYSGGGEYFSMPATTTVTYSYDNPQAPTKTYANYYFNTDCYPSKLREAKDNSDVNHERLWVSYDAANQDTVLVNSQWETTILAIEPTVVTEVGDRPIVKVKVRVANNTPLIEPNTTGFADPNADVSIVFDGYVEDVVNWTRLEFGTNGSPYAKKFPFPGGATHTMTYSNPDDPSTSTESYANYFFNLPDEGSPEKLIKWKENDKVNHERMWVVYPESGYHKVDSEWSTRVRPPRSE